jgi:hypothetical protein
MIVPVVVKPPENHLRTLVDLVTSLAPNSSLIYLDFLLNNFISAQTNKEGYLHIFVLISTFWQV